MEKHFFAGANTANGFVNLYDNIVNRESCSAFFVIKGGSGVGKSTMLKKIAAHFSKLGYALEYFHCSADIDSLDGLNIADYSIALVDGTSPHVVEGKYINSTDWTIDLSRCVSGDALVRAKPKLVELMRIKKSKYEDAYFYMSVAGKLYEYAYNKTTKMLDKELVAKDLAQKLISLDLSPTNRGCRKLFSSAITANGEISLRSEFNADKLYFLDGDKLTAHYYLEYLLDWARLNNYTYDIFYSPYSTDFVGDIILENRVIFTTNKLYMSQNSERIDTLKFVKERSYKDEIKYNLSICDAYTHKAIKLFDDAKKTHFDIEAIYRGAVNFDEVSQITKDIILKIEKLIEDKNKLDAKI